MELTIRDRLQVLQILPMNGSFDELFIVRSIMETLKFSDEEIEEHGLHQQEGGIQLKGNGAVVEFDILDDDFDFIQTILFAHEADDNLILGQVGLYEIFCK